MNAEIDTVENTRTPVSSSGSTSPMSAFENLKLRVKLLSGFGVVLAILLIVSVLAFWNFLKLNHEIEEYAELVAEASLAEG